VHLEAMADEFAENAVFRAVVEGRDLEFFGVTVRLALRRADREILFVVSRDVVRAPDERRLARRVLHVVAARHVLPALGALDRFGLADRQGGETALHRAIDAELLGERASIDFADAGNAVLLQVSVE